MSEGQRAGRKVGWTRGPGRPHRVYEALVPLTCRECQRTIAPGERFTRPLGRSDAYDRRPVCRTCRPFTE
jgi:hypothetical protein